MVRNELFRRVELLAHRSYGALAELGGWDAERWAEASAPYWAAHPSVGTGPTARGPALFQVAEVGDRGRVRQVLDDPDGDHDWALLAEVDLAASDEAGEAVVAVLALTDAADAVGGAR